jgi:hypothetical protein
VQIGSKKYVFGIVSSLSFVPMNMPRPPAKSAKAKKQRTGSFQGFSTIQPSNSATLDADHQVTESNNTVSEEEYYSDIVDDSCSGLGVQLRTHEVIKFRDRFLLTSTNA